MRPKSPALYRLRCEVSGRIRDWAIVARQTSSASGTALEEGILKSVETVVAFPGHKFVGLYILRTFSRCEKNKKESKDTNLGSYMYVRARRR